tara:strand:- start:94 stop:1122 length:1029 start_codon:yes stop_codon:yes gene_type:complete
MNKALTYDDILLVPKYSDIVSRTEIDIGNDLDDCTRLDLPIISSPMDTITEWEMAATMSKVGGLGIVHRYNDPREQVEMVERAFESMGEDDRKCIGAAIGVSGDYLNRAALLIDAGAEIICIDIAHGHHIMMHKALKRIKDEFKDVVHIMAGNIATADGYKQLVDWGADSVRAGIGGGSICSTRIQTGFGIPSIETIEQCANLGLGIPVIADGGVRNSGDIVKALAAGADFVMVGSMLAGTNQTPGAVTSRGGRKYKTYRGMASKEAQMDWRGVGAFSEGIATMVPYKGDAGYVLKEISEGIASGFSYAGARDIHELWSKAEFIRQSSAGRQESSTHILSRK